MTEEELDALEEWVNTQAKLGHLSNVILELIRLGRSYLDLKKYTWCENCNQYAPIEGNLVYKGSDLIWTCPYCEIVIIY